MIKSFKQFIKEEMNTGQVPVVHQGPYRNSGFLDKINIRRNPPNYVLVKNKKQLRFESNESQSSIHDTIS